VNLAQGSRYLWVANATDARALESSDKSTRTAATYYDNNQIKVQLTFSQAYTGNLELYAVDWDNQGRSETITVNGQTATLTNFSQGDWVTYSINQAANTTLTITVTSGTGPNAVLSGIFLD
jgi:hypothetical protein